MWRGEIGKVRNCLTIGFLRHSDIEGVGHRVPGAVLELVTLSENKHNFESQVRSGFLRFHMTQPTTK